MANRPAFPSLFLANNGILHLKGQTVEINTGWPLTVDYLIDTSPKQKLCDVLVWNYIWWCDGSWLDLDGFYISNEAYIDLFKVHIDLCYWKKPNTFTTRNFMNANATLHSAKKINKYQIKIYLKNINFIGWSAYSPVLRFHVLCPFRLRAILNIHNFRTLSFIQSRIRHVFGSPPI